MVTMPTNKDNQEVLDAISSLALATGKGFEDVRKRFDKVDDRLDNLQSQINRIETHILSDHQRRIETLERQIAH